MQFANRLQRLQERLDGPFLVTTLANIRYLTGFSGSNAFLLVSGSGAVFVTDGRYGEAAEKLVAELPGADLVVYQGDLLPNLAGVMSGHDRVALEADDVTWGFVGRLADRSGVEFVPVRGRVESLRLVKDADEVVALRAAAAAGDAAFAALDALAADASTEADLGWGLLSAMRRAGGNPPAWDPIVAVGPNAAVPHHRAGDTPLRRGLLLLDYGCVVAGYHSDMSRTVWRGERPDPEMARVYAAVLAAQQAGIDAVGPGVVAGDVDEACRLVLRESGLESHFLHSTGHGVGLHIHEGPRLARRSEDVLMPGHVVTVEPGVYLPGKGGVRIEDMVLVTADGNEVLTQSPKEMP